MRFLRYRLRSLMILVVVSAVILAIVAQVGRLDRLDLQRLKEGSILFVPFLIMIGLKLALVIGVRARRRVLDESTKPVSPDETVPYRRDGQD